MEISHGKLPAWSWFVRGCRGLRWFFAGAVYNGFMAKHPQRFSGGDDRRKSARCSCHPETCCQVFDPQAEHPLPAGVWNISRGGISLLLRPRFEPGRILTLELWNTARQFRCQLSIEVKYSGLCLPNGAWLHGCAFDRPLHPEELAALI
jgi:hypothetical protein